LRIVEGLFARGHPNILAEHSTTFEITKDAELTRRGECIIAVRATKGLMDFSAGFRRLCKNDETRVFVELKAAGIHETIHGRGNHLLSLTHPSEIVGRKSTYVSNRTLMIKADKAACDLSRELIESLKSPRTVLHVRIIAEL
jgi:hypothetical protein